MGAQIILGTPLFSANVFQWAGFRNVYGLPNYQVKKLQHVQKTAAHLISLSRKHEHITPILLHLH